MNGAGLLPYAKARKHLAERDDLSDRQRARIARAIDKAEKRSRSKRAKKAKLINERRAARAAHERLKQSFLDSLAQEGGEHVR